MKKFIILGLDRTGKTTAAELLSILSEGRISFKDTSEMLGDVPEIPKTLRLLAKKWQRDRNSSIVSADRKAFCRKSLADIYSTYSKEILDHNFKFADIYVGLRDEKVIEALRQNSDYVFIEVWAYERLIDASTSMSGIAALRASWKTRLAERNTNLTLFNNGSVNVLIDNCRQLIEYLEASGYLRKKTSVIGWIVTQWKLLRFLWRFHLEE